MKVKATTRDEQVVKKVCDIVTFTLDESEARELFRDLDSARGDASMKLWTELERLFGVQGQFK